MEEYTGKHRHPHQDEFYKDDNGMKMLIWTANHDSQYPIVRHTVTRKGKKLHKPKHGYGGIRYLMLRLGLDFYGNVIPASRFI